MIETNIEEERSSSSISSSAEAIKGTSGEPPATVSSHVSIPDIHSYQIKPHLAQKFKAAPVLEIVRTALTSKLAGQDYDADKAKTWTIELANEINDKVMELNMRRYKHIVQVTLGENKGAGVRSGMRCLWDADTDSYTKELYSTDALWCLVVVLGVYLY